MSPSTKKSSSPTSGANSMQDLNLYDMDVEDFSSDVPTDQLPSVEEVRVQAQMMMARGYGGSSGLSKKAKYYGAMFLVVVVFIGVLVPLLEKPFKGSDAIPRNVKKAVYRISLNGKKDFKDENSYQHVAMRWLVEDPMLQEEDYTYAELRQRYALYCLHHAMGGQSAWTDSTGWKRKSMPECEWHGVTCDEVTGLVTRVELANNGLRGEIPPELGLIDTLETLNLNANHNMKGSVPSHVCHLATSKNLNSVKVDENYVKCSCCDDAN